MWEPVGPLPASVYWRRRWVAIASLVSVLVVIVWSVTAAVSGLAEQATTIRPASHAASSAPQQASPPPPPPPSSPGVAGPAAPPPTSAPEPEVPAAAGLEQLLPDESPRLVAPAPTPVPVPSTGPVPCTNAMLVVGAEIDLPQHRVGQRPVLRLVVTNISGEPCVRDLDATRQEVVVWGGDGTRVWSSNDCSRASGADLRTLVPGQPVVFSVRWGGRTSAPGCPANRAVVPAGEYNLMTRVDDVISAATRFVREP